MRVIVEKIVYPGKALARGEDGIATFVEGALCGEEVEVTITRDKRTFREAKLAGIVKPSPERIVPSCTSFGKCGGCSFQHVEYARQLSLKETYLKELLSRWEAAIEPIVPSPKEWGYRNKMEFSFFPSAKGAEIGLHEKNEFNRYFAVPPCIICDEDFRSVIEAVMAFAQKSGKPAYDRRSHQGFYRHLVIRKGIHTGQVLVNLVTNRDAVTRDFLEPLVSALRGKVASFYWSVTGSVSDVAAAEELILLHGADMIEERLTVKGREYVFSISPFSFFQTNTLGTEKLYETAIDLFQGSADDAMLDLYCGTGTIGIMLAPYVKSVLGVEQVASAIENALLNSARNGVRNIRFEAGSVEKWIKHGEKPAFTSVVVDPPRGGLSSKVIEFLRKNICRKLLYISCNPATLARDLADLSDAYQVRRIRPVDMFPQTYHVETVVLLEPA